MTHRRKRPDDADMVLLCTLHWPAPCSYYLTRRYPGCWDFWVLSPGDDHAQLWPIARLNHPKTPDRKVGMELLEIYLEAIHPGQMPVLDPVPALLTDDDLLEVITTHQVRH